MNKADTTILIDRLRPYQPQRVMLFGSMAQGNAHQSSDVDIAIIKETDELFYRRARDVRKLLRSRIPLDVFVFTPAEYDQAKKTNPFVAEIDRTGTVIYDSATI